MEDPEPSLPVVAGGVVLIVLGCALRHRAAGSLRAAGGDDREGAKRKAGW